MLTVHRPGSVVTLAGTIDAHVVQVCVQTNDHVQYQLAWWDGNARKLEWVEAVEVMGQTPRPAPLTIGFANAAGEGA